MKIAQTTVITSMLALALLLSSCSTLEVKEFSIPDSELEVMSTKDGVAFVRTPESYFENLPDWSYEARYVDIDGLRQAYVDEGPGDGETILLLHGQPAWSYLYRFMIPELINAGYRVIAMDHLGMGRSDKPIDPGFYSYVYHVERLEAFIKELQLEGITAFVQDWGSLIGLNVIGNHPEWFNRVVLGNGTLPTWPEGHKPFNLPENPEEIEAASDRFYSLISKAPAKSIKLRNDDGEYTLLFRMRGGRHDFADWIVYSRHDERFRASQLTEAGTYYALTPEERAAYDAPFPARIAMAGTRVFPGLTMDMGGTTESAWEGLRSYKKPFLTIIGNQDGGPLGSVENQNYHIENIPGAEGQPHTRLMDAAHFLQDDQGVEVARLVLGFIAANPVTE